MGFLTAMAKHNQLSKVLDLWTFWRRNQGEFNIPTFMSRTISWGEHKVYDSVRYQNYPQEAREVDQLVGPDLFSRI